MGHHHRTKTKQKLSGGALPAYLRHLADSYEAGALLVGDESVPLDTIGSFKVRLRHRHASDEMTITTTLTPAHADTPQSASRATTGDHPAPGVPLPDYPDLKRSMKAKLAHITGALGEDRLPDEPLVEAFYEACVTMTRYPGRGDDLYLPFLQEASTLRHHVTKHDLPAARASLARLRSLTREAHARYK